jgi:hypothetical protein
MDHVPALPRAEPAGRTSSAREPTAASAAVPPVSTEAERMAAALMKYCPGSLVWFGTRTRRWWAFAMLRGAWTLVETETVEGIAQALMASGGHGFSADSGSVAGRYGQEVSRDGSTVG